MKFRQWTLLVVRHGETTTSRQVRLTSNAVRLGIAASLLAFSLLVTLCAQVMVRLQGPRHAGRLTRENAALKSELQQIRAQVSNLDATVAELSRKDEHIRLIAGLEPLDEGVRRAGIGGPDESDELNAALLGLDRSAMEVTLGLGGELSELLRRARVLAASWTEARDSIAMKHDRMASTPSILPTDGVISSAFSRWRWHPILDRPRAHEGVDIAARRGTPILAAAKGRVTFVGDNGAYGLMVEIDHGYGYVTRYAHASRLLAKRGDEVKRGAAIAEVGETGLAVAPHLHYEVLVFGKPVNPRQFVLSLDVIPD